MKDWERDSQQRLFDGVAVKDLVCIHPVPTGNYVTILPRVDTYGNVMWYDATSGGYDDMGGYHPDFDFAEGSFRLVVGRQYTGMVVNKEEWEDGLGNHREGIHVLLADAVVYLDREWLGEGLNVVLEVLR